MRQRLMPIFGAGAGARNSFSQADVQKFEPYLKAVDARDSWEWAAPIEIMVMTQGLYNSTIP